MVVFCCSVCCDSLKKNQVQKHYSRCRMGMVSCMDCSQEFFGDDYQQHIKCISEEEKYSGKDYKPRPGQNKGEAKQEAWLEQVQKAIDQVSNQAPKLRSLLERMKDYPNIPRKQAKFLNFVRNSLGVYDPKLATSVWDILMPVQPKEAEPPVNGKQENCDDDDDKNKNGESAENMEVDEEEEGEEVETKKAKKINKREKKEERRKEMNKQEKKEKKKQMANGGDDAGEVENERPTKKKGKKRKRNADLSEGEEMEITVAAEEAKKKKKKTHKVQQKDDDDDDGMLPLEPNPNHASLGETEEVEDEEEEEEGEDSPPKKKRQPKKKFDWEEVIFALLENAKEKSMSEKKLRKKVLAEYMDQGGHVDSMSLLLAKFERKIKKNPQLLRLKDTVSLRERQKY